MNSVNLIGRVATDLFLTTTESGTDRVWFKIAVDRPTKDDQADFFPVIAWNGQAKACKNVLQKGDLVGIDGSLRSFRKTENEGDHSTYTDTLEVNARSVQFLRVKAWASDNEQSQAQATLDQETPEAASPAPAEEPETKSEEGGDDIPF